MARTEGKRSRKETALARIQKEERALLELGEAAEHAREFARASIAENTKRAYAADWRDFSSWCTDHGLESLPAAPDTVALYLAAQARAGRKVSTITRRIASITKAHQTAGHETPTRAPSVRIVMTGIRRKVGTRRSAKAAVDAGMLARVAKDLPRDFRGLRDRAILLVGFVGGFRRSELAGLDVPDVTFSEKGAVVMVRRSKTDQGGQGLAKEVPFGRHPETCPVRALREWLDGGEIADGPVFREIDARGRLRTGRMSGRAVCRLVKRAAERIGLDPDRFGAHSLRSGFATAGVLNGISTYDLKRQGGWKSDAVMQGYIREAERFRVDYAGGLGL
jgi:integrase